MACGNPLRRSRGAWPFLALALGLLRWQYDVTFCGVSSMSSSHGRRGNVARGWRHPFQAKSEQPAQIQNINTMGTVDVSQWLASMGFEQYSPQFKDANIDGPMLANLTDEDLQEIGVDRGIDRKNILRRVADLIAKGWAKTASSGSLWRPQTEDIVPDRGVKRLATAVLKHVRGEGLEIGLPEETLVRELDNLFCDKLEQRDFLNTLEAVNSMLWSHTALVPGVLTGASVRHEIQEDSVQILQQAHWLQKRTAAFSSATQQLAVAMLTYSRSMKEKMNDSERSAAKSKFDQRLQTWKEKISELAQGASACSDALFQRTSARLRSQLPGGQAVANNLDDLAKLIHQQEEAANKCQRIYNLADRDVQLALTARQGGLKDLVHDAEEKLRRLEERQNQLEEQRKEYESLKEKNQELRSQQRNATKQIRDWHIMRFWRSAWKPEMDAYENQVKEDEERRAADDENLDVKLRAREEELMNIEDEKVKVQKDIQDLKSKDSSEFWQEILAAQGLLTAESEVKDIGNKLRIVQDQLREAMEKTGVANPHLAARILAGHETAKTMLSETMEKTTDAAERMEGWVDQAEMTINDSSHAMDALATALLSLPQAHQEQQRSRKKSMSTQEALKRLLESASAADFLEPFEGNATLTA